MKTYIEIQAEIAELQEQAKEARKKEVTIAIAEIKEKMRIYEITISDLRETPPKKVAKPVKAKYQEPGGTRRWSGRGIPPKWYKEALAGGVAKEALEIK